ncbi:MAG: hypothetical protein P8Y70_05055 [Candidatus Lokiarchaeota archaeon]
MRLRFSIVSLTSCSGCISTLFSLDIISQFMERSSFNYFPFISDMKEIQDHDITLVEGCVSKKSQIEILQKLRKHSKKIYALGSCAAFGGILSLAENKDAKPISKYIDIDGIIPGCPPPENLFGNCLIRLMENKEISLSQKTLCFECPLKKQNGINVNKKIEKILPDLDLLDNNKSEECFLSRGILCFGPITRDGCEHKCIIQNVPCEGCMGPVAKDQLSNIINFMSLYKISKNLKEEKSLYFKFSKPEL